MLQEESGAAVSAPRLVIAEPNSLRVIIFSLGSAADQIQDCILKGVVLKDLVFLIRVALHHFILPMFSCLSVYHSPYEKFPIGNIVCTISLTQITSIN